MKKRVIVDYNMGTTKKERDLLLTITISMISEKHKKKKNFIRELKIT